MKLAHDVQSVAHVIKKGGRGSRGKRQVIDITPIVLAEIRDGIRGLSDRMDRIEQRMDGLERQQVLLRQDVYGEINKLRTHMDRRFDLLDRRVGALETQVGALEAQVGALEAAVFQRH